MATDRPGSTGGFAGVRPLHCKWIGTELQLPDLEAAREEALEGARDLWASAIKSADGRDLLDCAILITDEHGHELTRVLFADALPPRLRPSAAS